MPHSKVHEAFSEVYSDEPKVVSKTRKKFGKKRAHKQKTAIALNKARKEGASIPFTSKPGAVRKGI